MPYKDHNKQQEAWRRYYHRNKVSFRIRFDMKRRKLRDEIWRLKSIPCLDCKTSFPPCAMQFDHIKGKKRDTIARLVNNGMAKALGKEMKKCEIICSNCHSIRTFKRSHTKKQWENMVAMAER